MRIITGSEPKTKTYAIPGSPRDIVFAQHETIRIPEVSNDYRREVTRIDFADGTTVFSFNKVDVQAKGLKMEVSSQMIYSMPPSELKKWIEKRARYEEVPTEASLDRREDLTLDVVVYTWRWWEVSL